MKEEIDYNFVVKNSSELFSIKILRGKFKDTIFTYGKVSIHEDGKNATLRFDYRIEESPLDIKSLEGNKKFKNMMGDILTSILSEKDIRIGSDDERTTITDT